MHGCLCAYTNVQAHSHKHKHTHAHTGVTTASACDSVHTLCKQWNLFFYIYYVFLFLCRVFFCFFLFAFPLCDYCNKRLGAGSRIFKREEHSVSTGELGTFASIVVDLRSTQLKEIEHTNTHTKKPKCEAFIIDLITESRIASSPLHFLAFPSPLLPFFFLLTLSTFCLLQLCLILTGTLITHCVFASFFFLMIYGTHIQHTHTQKESNVLDRYRLCILLFVCLLCFAIFGDAASV